MADNATYGVDDKCDTLTNNYILDKRQTMIKGVLLTSEDYIKTNSHLNENVFGEYLLPAIREAQDIELQQILGSCLYEKLLELVDSGDIAEPENEQYKVLLDDYVQDYMMYQVITDLVPIIGSKIANIGTVISNDEHLVGLTEDERNRLQQHYQIRADFYCRRMQEFLLNNRTAFSELNACDCERIEKNLKSAASTGVWLGGFRGRRIR